MKKIRLTQGKVTLVDDDLFETLNQFNWHARKIKKTFYAGRGIRLPDGKHKILPMHRFVFELLGEPVPRQTDHRDHDGLNNQRDNLRPATCSDNIRNRRKPSNNTSGYLGVCWYKPLQKWAAYARLNDKRKHLGYFHDPRAAAKVRDNFVKLHYGDFAVLNFPERKKSA